MHRLALILEKEANANRQDAIDLLDLRVALQNSIINEAKRRNKEKMFDSKRQLADLGEEGTTTQVKKMKGRSKVAKYVSEQIKKLAVKRLQGIRDPRGRVKCLDLISSWANLESSTSQSEMLRMEALLEKIKARHAKIK